MGILTKLRNLKKRTCQGDCPMLAELRVRAEAAESECCQLTINLQHAKWDLEEAQVKHRGQARELERLRKLESDYNADVARLHTVAPKPGSQAAKFVHTLAEQHRTIAELVKECDGLRGDVAAAEQEVARLQNLGIEQAEASELVGVTAEGGEVEVSMRPPHWAIRALAASFFETLGDTPNWHAMSVGPMHHGGVSLVVTVRRMSGETPEETVGKFRGVLDEWRERYAGETNGDDDLVARTLALLNPTKGE